MSRLSTTAGLIGLISVLMAPCAYADSSDDAHLDEANRRRDIIVSEAQQGMAEIKLAEQAGTDMTAACAHARVAIPHFKDAKDWADNLVVYMRLNLSENEDAFARVSTLRDQVTDMYNGSQEDYASQCESPAG